MKKLIQLENVKRFLQLNCREIENARFNLIFYDGDKEQVRNSLQRYQNEDGGFGHGIEPDFWAPTSSPMATWAAGQILMEIGAEKTDPMVEAMVGYLVSTFHRDTGMWDAVMPANNQYPHAPWWHWSEGVQENWAFNPGVELAAFLINWSDENSEAFRIGWDSIDKAVSHLMNQAEMDRHEINNYQAFIKIIEPFKSELERKITHSYDAISEKVLSLAYECINKDVSSWNSGYEPLPLDFVDSPSHPLCERLGTLIEQNLALYLNQMTDEGVWDVPWSWGAYPAEFEVAKMQWTGILAVNRYKQLMEFGYLE
ncbi:hypothetical protein [Ornithinibacillus bavariensis]|uniref:hypothetical protein n=1 Tax=Ornithinibacillus bavariensis TaxID=545502 RepID=UPI000EDA45D3|nr:hypothetical protein [Ornithinibacillus sp.]